MSGERGEEGAGGKRRVCLETDPDHSHGRWMMKPGEEMWKHTLKPGGFCSAKTRGEKKRLNVLQRESTGTW